MKELTEKDLIFIGVDEKEEKLFWEYILQEIATYSVPPNKNDKLAQLPF